jgi:hypothetical protein
VFALGGFQVRHDLKTNLKGSSPIALARTDNVHAPISLFDDVDAED